MGLKDGVNTAWDKVLSPLFEEFSDEVQIESVDKGATTIDPLYDEPVVEKVFTDPVMIHVRLKFKKDRLILPGGEDIEIDGKVTVRSDELEAKGITLDIGSRVIFKGGRYTVVHRETRVQVGDKFLLVRVAIVQETG